MNEERNHKILAMYGNGQSSGKIAMAIGVTRNVVIGVIDRNRRDGEAAQLYDIRERMSSARPTWNAICVVGGCFNKALPTKRCCSLHDAVRASVAPGGSFIRPVSRARLMAGR